MKVIDGITEVISEYNRKSWTTTDIVGLLLMKRKLSGYYYLLGVELGKARAEETAAELSLKLIRYQLEREFAGQGESSNAAEKIANRHERTCEARERLADARRVVSLMYAPWASCETTIVDMGQLLKSLENEKMYHNNIQS